MRIQCVQDACIKRVVHDAFTKYVDDSEVSQGGLNLEKLAH